MYHGLHPWLLKGNSFGVRRAFGILKNIVPTPSPASQYYNKTFVVAACFV
jgi:hypothetical protein